MNGDNVTYFEVFGFEHISNEIKEFISNKSIKVNIYRIQANDSIMYGYFCIGFTDYTNKKHEKYDKIILKHFQ